MLADIQEILLTESVIQSRLDEIAHQLTEDYRGKELTLIAILNGSLVFTADLIRRISLPLQIDCLSVSSYQGDQSTGKVQFHQTTLPDISGRHLLLVDDILDSGRTLHAICERFQRESQAASIKTCVLLKKNVVRAKPIDADYFGFEIPNEFVVGYGLDYKELYRNLPFVGILSPETISRP